MKFTCINIQGNLISEEVLNKIADASASAQSPKDFGLEPGANLRDEIEYAWSRIKLDWKHFSERRGSLTAKDQFGTSLSRKWMEQFFSSLGYELEKHRADLIGGNNQKYSISHTSSTNDGMPILIVGFADDKHPEKNTLDIKSSGGTSRLSPHGTVQEYLNVTGHVYGFAANGYTLRLIRDSGRLVKLSYLEFDLKRLLDEDKYSEFTVLYRLLHASRFPIKKEEATHAPIDKYYNESIETGNRIRDGLSLAVKESMVALGNGFLQHPYNDALRQALINKELTPKKYYDQLRRLVYRLLFLMVTEERDLIYDPEDKTDETAKYKSIYLKHYSIGRLRKLSQHRYLYEASFTDIWQGLVNTFRLFEDGGNGMILGIKPLAGDLFSDDALGDITQCTISNNLLLECLRNLNEFEDKGSRNLVPINYRALDVEELGSVYEGLLELHPVIDNLESSNPSNINFTFHEGTERKTTGSYYTRPDLVNELIKSALIPVIEERLKEAGSDKEKKLKALLKLKVCDAAAGSGHMILAAARTIAWYMAVVDTGEENPPPSKYRYWLREAIQHCVYAVDMNPDAVELCKLALWLEGHNSGKPLSFLDHKIRNGNSLVGVTDLSVLKKGIPNEAFDPVTGDDKNICSELKKENHRFLKYLEGRTDIGFQQGLNFDQTQSAQHELAGAYSELENIRQDDVDSVNKVKHKFSEMRSNHQWWTDWTACNLWTSAFFIEYIEKHKQSVVTSERLSKYVDNPSASFGPMIGSANACSIENGFFHWPLEFPDVFDHGGFDVILGNPPWEIVELSVKEYFTGTNNKIVSAPNDKLRKKYIDELRYNDPVLYGQYIRQKHIVDAQRKFIQSSTRFPDSSGGRIDLYPLFIENSLILISKHGRIGLIVPSEISTGAYTSKLFSKIVEQKQLSSYYDFENTKGLFSNVDSRKRFSLLTLNGLDNNQDKIAFIYYAHDVSDLLIPERKIILTFSDLQLFSPNTSSTPIFQNEFELNLAKKTYSTYGVFINKKNGTNRWNAVINRMFSISDPGVDFKSNFELTPAEKKDWTRIYGGKNIHQFNHRFATSSGNKVRDVTAEELSNFNFEIETESYAPVLERTKRLGNKHPNTFLIGYRGVTRGVDERSCISSILPIVGCDTSCRNIFSSESTSNLLCLVSNMNSLVFDFFTRQRLIGANLTAGIFEQLPVLPPSTYSNDIKIAILKAAIELTYCSWDVKSFVDQFWKDEDEQVKKHIKIQWDENRHVTSHRESLLQQENLIDPRSCPIPPFKWDVERRAVLKAELDAIYAKLYGLTTEELRYILDPQDVYGPDFPGETFRVLKEKEIKQYGEYRTRRLVLEAWERLNKES